MGIVFTIAKLTITAGLLYLLAEIAKRSAVFAALLASLPITCIFAATMLYWETGDVERVASFTSGVLWMIYPSLVFFVVFPMLLRRGMGFSVSLVLSIAIMIAVYGAYAFILRWFSIKL